MTKNIENQAKYYAYKILIGTDKRYLPLISNIAEMKKISDESYLIMDDDSLRMARQNFYQENLSYYDLIQQSGVKILTTNELVELTTENAELRKDAIWCFDKYKELTNFKFKNLDLDHHFEVLPKSTSADFVKSFTIHGPLHQHPDSINLSFDLDNKMSGEPNLPENPRDFITGYDLGYNTMLSLKPGISLSSLLTSEDKKLLKDPKLKKKWSQLENELHSGKRYSSFITKEVNREKIPQEFILAEGVEVIAARSGALTIEDSIRETKEMLVEFFDILENQLAEQLRNFPDEVKIEKFNSYLQKHREFFVNRSLAAAFNLWKTEAKSTEIYVEDFSVNSRQIIETWKSLKKESDKNSETKFTDSPIIKSNEELKHLPSLILKQFQKEIAQEEAETKTTTPNSAKTSQKFFEDISPKPNEIRTPDIANNKIKPIGALAITSGITTATAVSSEFWLPVAAVLVLAAGLYYKYGAKTTDKTRDDKSR